MMSMYLLSLSFLLATWLQISQSQFLQVDVYSADGCDTSAYTGYTFFVGIGVCGSTSGTAPYTMNTVPDSDDDSASYMVITNYDTSSCEDTGTIIQDTGTMAIGGTCSLNDLGYVTVMEVTDITSPSNAMGQLWWTSEADCRDGITTSGLYDAFYTPLADTVALQCSSNNNQVYVCPSAFTSTSGGFLVQNYYDTADCMGTPVQTQAIQMGVCLVQSTDSTLASSSYVPLTLPNGVTQFNTITYTGSDTCTSGTDVTTSVASTGISTTTCTEILDSSGPVGAGYYTMSLATSVGIISGFATAQYTTSDGCAAATTSAIIQLTSQPSTCSIVSPSSIMYNTFSLSSCPEVISTPVVIYASTK